MTSDLADAPEFWVTAVPSDTNGLRTPSQVMAEKPVTLRWTRIGPLEAIPGMGQMPQKGYYVNSSDDGIFPSTEKPR